MPKIIKEGHMLIEEQLKDEMGIAVNWAR